MLDTWLLAALLEATSSNCRIVFVGDVSQLPSVGPGRILADLTKRGAVPFAELTQLKRHNPDLLIAKNCAEIKAGRAPIIDNAKAKDFFFIDARTEGEIADAVVSVATKRLPARYGVDPNRDVIVLTALRDKGMLIAKELNVRLRRELTPESEGDSFEPGDRVIQLSNNYALDVWNGDIGTVIKRNGKNLTVRFDTPPRLVTEDRDDERALTLGHGWCLTIHKSQGSQWPWVVIPVHESLGTMVPDRALLYTGISRAMQGCVLVGSRRVMNEWIQRIRPQQRCTRLGDLLT